MRRKIKSTRLLPALLATCAGVLVAVTAAVAQDPALDTVYAQVEPLVTKSLLLDVTRGPAGQFVAVGERGHIIHSPDGEHWTQAEHVPTRSTLTSVTAFGDRLWAAGHDTVILTSADGGVTWTLQNFDPDRQQPIMDILFTDVSTGFAIGAYGLMLVTSDAGAHWEDRKVSDEEWHLNAIVDLGGGTLVMAGESGLAYRSTDAGETWEVIDLPYQGSMWGITMTGGDCLLTFGLRGHVQESCDQGQSWEELETGTEASLGGGVRVGDLTVLVGNSGAILERSGRGAFKVFTHPSGVDLSAVIGMDDGRLLMVGEDGVHHFPETGEAEAQP